MKKIVYFFLSGSILHRVRASRERRLLGRLSHRVEPNDEGLGVHDGPAA